MSHELDPGQALIARHPIFDSQQRVIAYELNYHRDTNLGDMMAMDPDASSSSEVILSTYTSISDQGEVKRVPAFLPVPLEMINSSTMPKLPTKQVVLMISAPTGRHSECASALRQILKDGYRVTLEIGNYTPDLAPLLKMANIVKLDVSLMQEDELKARVRELLPHKVTLLASNIQSIEQLEHCIEAGFKLFEGSFLSRPKVIKGRRVSANQVTLMQLIQELQKPNTKPEVLEELIIRDPVLTYKLLRIVNSAAYSLVRKVESIAEAVVLLGMDQVRKWATLIAMTNQDNKPEELSRALLIRGRMCELIAEGEKRPNAASYFMTGMMSGLHVMLDIDQQTMLEQVPLGDDIKSAIANHEGDMGRILEQATAYENGDWEELPADFNVTLFESAYRNSLHWAKESMQAMYE
ncbi:HDOD domain-containing protein [Marinobacterium sp. D7]|uniref:EAL and HDOD domain-containing protein n=1 Tax=Marinobacterium ramblicola TaxID=2849041 RepID=UPI001C2D0F79|nr:HDOD domain-containing protein [Marinobacterium ramblicola]MBV1786581.1 HDOD domain-containing protein [Marinobacterium ramblicola]